MEASNRAAPEADLLQPYDTCGWAENIRTRLSS